MIPPERLAWMAAVIDLKALLLRKNNKTRATPQMVLVVDSKNFAVIDRLCEMSGTSPEAKRIQEVKEEWMRRGCVEHCPDAHIHHHDGWQMPETRRWSSTGAAAATILHNLRPYLVDPDKPYDEFITKAIANATLTGQGSGATKSALARLVTLGWALPPALAKDLLELAAISGQASA